MRCICACKEGRGLQGEKGRLRQEARGVRNLQLDAKERLPSLTRWSGEGVGLQAQRDPVHVQCRYHMLVCSQPLAELHTVAMVSVLRVCCTCL